MLAEYDALRDPGVRRRFARGCLRAVVASPTRADRTATALRGLSDLFVACAIALATYGLVRFPGVRVGWAWLVALAVFLLTVSGYAFGCSRLSRLGSPQNRWLGVLAGTPAALCGWWAASSNSVVSLPLVMVAAVPIVIVALYVIRRHRRADEAVVAVSGASLTAGLVTFIAYLSTTYATGGGPSTPVLFHQLARSGAPDHPSWRIADNFGASVFLLLFVPLVALTLGSSSPDWPRRATPPIPLSPEHPPPKGGRLRVLGTKQLAG